MWTVIGTVLSFLLKFVFNKIAKRKLSDEEFLKHIEAHQAKRRGAGKTALDFDEAMEKTRKEIAENKKKKTKKTKKS